MKHYLYEPQRCTVVRVWKGDLIVLHVQSTANTCLPSTELEHFVSTSHHCWQWTCRSENFHLLHCWFCGQQSWKSVRINTWSYSCLWLFFYVWNLLVRNLHANTCSWTLSIDVLSFTFGINTLLVLPVTFLTADFILIFEHILMKNLWLYCFHSLYR